MTDADQYEIGWMALMEYCLTKYGWDEHRSLIYCWCVFGRMLDKDYVKMIH